MCDFSLSSVKSRLEKISDKLTTYNFGTGTTGFKSVEDSATGNAATAVCLLPGTELAFDREPSVSPGFMGKKTIPHRTARFRQINLGAAASHHDALEFPDGTQVLLTCFTQGQTAMVLQLPADPNAKHVNSETGVVTGAEGAGFGTPARETELAEANGG